MIFNPILKQINLDNFVLKMKQKKSFKLYNRSYSSIKI